ncbi:MAG: hypothetical protein LBC60_00500, partial [Spirochaetaceae bacterium]|nr:hypothetical protein [Spirochaetaceae bacterium]
MLLEMPVIAKAREPPASGPDVLQEVPDLIPGKPHAFRGVQLFVRGSLSEYTESGDGPNAALFIGQ